MLIINQNFPEILTSKCICSVLGGKPLGSVFVSYVFLMKWSCCGSEWDIREVQESQSRE